MTGTHEELYTNKQRLFSLLYPIDNSISSTNYKIKTFKKGQDIFLYGDVSNDLYLILAGKVKVSRYRPNKKEIAKAILAEKELFGEMVLTGEQNRTVNARALDTNTKICIIPLAQIQKMMRGDEALSFAIIEYLGEKLRKVEGSLDSLMYDNVRTRLIHFLKELAFEKGQKVGFETIIRGHYSHKDIGHLTGISRQGVTTVLNELRAKKLISYDKRRMLIRDLDALS